jgi:ssDNA-specific exonuclease RecJ
MREEITNEKIQYWHDDLIIHQLRRNVQIGHIKRAIRLATIARKAERVMTSPDMKASDVSGKALSDVTEFSYYFTDSQSNKKYLAGVTIRDEADENFVLIHKFKLSDVETITPELLHERSERRCIRLKKPHTILHGNTP